MLQDWLARMFGWIPGYSRSKSLGSNFSNSIQSRPPRLDRWEIGTLCEIFGYIGVTFQVTEIWHYHEDGDYFWVEYKLVSPNLPPYFLYVMYEDGEWEAAIYKEEVTIDDVQSFLDHNPPTTLSINGQTYRLMEANFAYSTLTTDIMTKGQRERMFFADYEGRDGKVLGVEVYGKEVEIWTGEKIEDRHVEHLGKSEVF